MLKIFGEERVVGFSDELGQDLYIGFELLLDKMFDSLKHVNKKDPDLKESWLWDILPPIGKRALEKGEGFILCRRFIGTLYTLAFKVLESPPLRLGCFAEELMLAWIVAEAKTYNDILCDDGQISKAELKKRNKRLDVWLGRVLKWSDYQLLYDERPFSSLVCRTASELFIPYDDEVAINPLIRPSMKEYPAHRRRVPWI